METNEKSLPSGFHLIKNGATYKIVDTETDNVVSLGYHKINYPVLR